MLSKQLLNNLSTEEGINRQFEKYSEKNVLFITPTLTGENFYRIMMPYAMLLRKGFGAAILGIQSHNPTQLYEKRVTMAISSRRIVWATSIVFPFTTQSLKTVFQQIKTINPNCKIVYNVDFNIFHLPSYHPLKEEITAEHLKNVEENILYADLTLVDNELFKDYLLNKHFAEKTEIVERPKVKISDNFVWEPANGIEVFPIIGNYMAMYGEAPPPQQESSVVKLAIPVGEWQHQELKQVCQALSGLQGKTNILEVLVLGGNKSDEKFIKAIGDLKIKHFPPRPLYEYYQVLVESHIDLFLYLSRDTFFHKTSEDMKKIVDFGILGVPVIITKNSVLAAQIKDGQNGFLLDKTKFLSQVLEQILPNRGLLHRCGASAFDTTIKNLSYDNSLASDTIISLLV